MPDASSSGSVRRSGHVLQCTYLYTLTYLITPTKSNPAIHVFIYILIYQIPPTKSNPAVHIFIYVNILNYTDQDKPCNIYRYAKIPNYTKSNPTVHVFIYVNIPNYTLQYMSNYILTYQITLIRLHPTCVNLFYLTYQITPIRSWPARQVVIHTNIPTYAVQVMTCNRYQHTT